MLVRIFPVLCTLLWAVLIPVDGKTRDSDASALGVMYSSLNSPSKLTGWSSNGRDPCGENWKGITCSGSSVTEIKLSGLQLSGSLGYQLSSLTSVTHFDVSMNNLQGDIPYQLPPNAVYLNLASNRFTGGVPYSVSQMPELKYLNVGHNKLDGQLTDMFKNLSKLSVLDLSSNSLSGNLPQSFGSLSSLQSMYLQNNQFTGTIKALSKLHLKDLNVAHNHFTGWIPNKLMDIDNIETEGNSWSNRPAPPGSNQESKLDKQREIKEAKKFGMRGILGVTFGLISAALILLVILLASLRKSSKSSPSQFLDEEKIGHNRSPSALVSHELKETNLMKQSATINISSLQTADPLKHKSPSDRQNSFYNADSACNSNAKENTDPITVTRYAFVDVQEATSSFSPSCFIGEGSIGSIYKAKFPDGKVLAVTKVDSHSSEDFTKVISGISRLQHPNITKLVGFCVEHGHHFLLYDFMRNMSLYDFLHLSDDYCNPLTWNTRVRIALGIAQALAYLHEEITPSVVHRNIKSANILLDAELKPSLLDCGLANFYQDVSKHKEAGYRAPECTTPSTYSSKSDIYSFGVVMLELLTGQMSFDSSEMKTEQSLVERATPQLRDIAALDKIVDPGLRGLYPPKSLTRFADTIALCVQPEPDFRPPMSKVAQSLIICLKLPSEMLFFEFSLQGADSIYIIEYKCV